MPIDIVTWRQRIGKFNCFKFPTLSSTCPPDFYLLKFLIFIFHVIFITGSVTFRILASISTLFYFCVVTILALGIILCFYCLLLTYEYHFVESVSFSRAYFHISIKTFSLSYFFARAHSRMPSQFWYFCCMRILVKWTNTQRKCFNSRFFPWSIQGGQISDCS